MSFHGYSVSRIKLRDYLMGKTLGVGSFGKVKLAEHHITGQLVAVKIINRAKIEELKVTDKIRREVRVTQSFNHPHIVKLYDVVETPSDLFLVQEYASMGELFDYIIGRGRLPEWEARKYFQQIISALDYCHTRGVAHRDLKPENLLLTRDKNIKVADFGLANVFQDGQFLRTSCGSPNYAAPEVLYGNLYGGPEIDIWSCGVILYALLCGSLPFDDESITKLFKKIKNGIYSTPHHLGRLAQNLISKMLVVEPLRRINMKEIKSHKWYLTDLPPYLAEENFQNLTSKCEDESEIDHSIVKRILEYRDKIEYVQNTGQKGVIKAILSPYCNVVRTIYFLMLDQKHTDLIRRQSSGNLNSRTSETERTNYYQYDDLMNRSQLYDFDVPSSVGEGNQGPLDVSSSRVSPRSIASFNQGHPAMIPPTRNGMAPGTSPFTKEGLKLMNADSNQHKRVMDVDNIKDDDPSSDKKRLRVEINVEPLQRRKWYLGIQSKKYPHVVMDEVKRVLTEIACDYRTSESEPRRILCRWKPPNPRDSPERPPVYLQLQLYRVQNSIYVLDFLKLNIRTHALDFLMLCRRIIKELKPPASSDQSSKNG